MNTKKKTDGGEGFDCVAFKRRAQARIYERLKGLSPEEGIAYFRRAAEEGPLGDWWKAAEDGGRAET